MNTRSKKRYEVLGGPLCGEKHNRGVRFCCTDHGVTHFYRRIRLLTDDRKRSMTYYHYFGTNPHRACTAPPVMTLAESKFRPCKRK